MVYALFILSSFLGILICRLIIQYLLKKQNSFTEKLCSTKGKFNCDKVLRSGFGKLSKNVHLGDIGLFYFISQFIFLLFSLINRWELVYITILDIPAVIAFLSTLILLWFQWRVVKNWCKLCLLITGVIWLQALILTWYQIVEKTIFGISSFDDIFFEKITPVFFTGLICLIIASGWFVIKPFVLKANEVGQVRKQIMRWKYNPNLFLSVLKDQPFINSEIWENDFILGKANARVRFITAINTYCPACADEYNKLIELLKMHPNDLTIVFRFLVKTDEKNTPTEAVQYLLNEYFNSTQLEKEKILGDWFNKPEIERLREKYKGNNTTDTNLLNKYQNWFQESSITHTPTLFLNGYKFPPPFTLKDFKILLPQIIKSNAILFPMENSHITKAILAQ